MQIDPSVLTAAVHAAGREPPVLPDRPDNIFREDGIGMKNPTGFTSELEAICAGKCAEFGDPPCWKLPELVEPCEHITPCDECLADTERGT